MDFKQTLLNIVSNPSFQPPENFMDLDLTSLKTILEGCGKKICVKFAIGEARLVLPIFEEACPKDNRPRKAIETAELWFSNSDDTCTGSVFLNASAARAAAANSNSYAAYDAADAAYASADAACYAASAAAAACYAACYARAAAADINLEDQLMRLFKLMSNNDE